MKSYLQDIWRCRYFWMSLVRMDLRNRYRRSILGVGWSLLNPIAMTIVMCVVFHKVFKQPLAEFAPWLLAGLATWNYVLTATLQGCQCFFVGEQYIRQYPAPLAIYPLRTVLGATIHFLIALVVVFCLTSYCNGLPSLQAILSLIPSIGLLFLFGWFLAILMGFTNVLFKDTQHLAEVGMQIVFYASGVIMPLSMYRDFGLSWLVNYNPIVVFMELIRQPMCQGRPPDASIVVKSLATLVILAGTSGLMLYRQQKKLIFHL